jgi:hypothetical protein
VEVVRARVGPLVRAKIFDFLFPFTDRGERASARCQ